MHLNSQIVKRISRYAYLFVKLFGAYCIDIVKRKWILIAPEREGYQKAWAIMRKSISSQPHA